MVFDRAVVDSIDKELNYFWRCGFCTEKSDNWGCIPLLFFWNCSWSKEKRVFEGVESTLNSLKDPCI